MVARQGGNRRAGLICLHCNTLIVSLHRHDVRECSCGEVAVGGGGDYIRVSATPEAEYLYTRVTLKDSPAWAKIRDIKNRRDRQGTALA